MAQRRYILYQENCGGEASRLLGSNAHSRRYQSRDTRPLDCSRLCTPVSSWTQLSIPTGGAAQGANARIKAGCTATWHQQVNALSALKSRRHTVQVDHKTSIAAMDVQPRRVRSMARNEKGGAHMSHFDEYFNEATYTKVAVLVCALAFIWLAIPILFVLTTR